MFYYYYHYYYYNNYYYIIITIIILLSQYNYCSCAVIPLLSCLVMHIALRAPATTQLFVDGVDVVPDVHRVLNQIEQFSHDIRTGRRVGVTGKRLTTVISIGIGGSYLGISFL